MRADGRTTVSDDDMWAAVRMVGGNVEPAPAPITEDEGEGAAAAEVEAGGARAARAARKRSRTARQARMEMRDEAEWWERALHCGKARVDA